jgi:hypothetical protein
MKWFWHLLRLTILLGLALPVLSCRPQPQSASNPRLAAEGACRDFLSRVDRAVAQSGAKDTAAFPIAEFPYLRSNRFWAYIGPKLATEAQVTQWLQQMHAMDLAARGKEIARLPLEQVAVLKPAASTAASRQALLAQTLACSTSLFDQAVGQADLQNRVTAATHVPDEYETWRRIAGFYPLLALPVVWASDAAFDKFRRWHLTPPGELPVIGALRTYRPPPRPPDAAAQVKAIFAPHRRDPLGLPVLTPANEQFLALFFAPVIVQDAVAAYDRIGPVAWQDGRVVVAPAAPVVYHYLSHALFQSEPILQINYTFWYSQRMGSEAPWFEHGDLDGLTVRVSLDPDGEPFLVDIMNNCGCYHFFLPAESRVRTLRHTLGQVAPLVPAWLPSRFPQEYLTLRISTGWHQVQHVGSTPAASKGVSYDLLPYEALETLPAGQALRRSMFDQDGIAYNSSRIEPLIFFSMGIPDVGSMRQRGHHAIKLVGRAHFDDPTLFDRTFVYRQ